MNVNPSAFAGLLTLAINRIHANECKKKTVIRDELGYAAGREGRTAIDYWCRDGGHIPADCEAVEGLAREIARRRGLSFFEMEAFLVSAGYPNARAFAQELCPRGPVADARRPVAALPPPCPEEQEEDEQGTPEEAHEVPAVAATNAETPPAGLANTAASQRISLPSPIVYSAAVLLALAIIIATGAALSFGSSANLLYRDPGQIQLVGAERDRLTLEVAENRPAQQTGVLVGEPVTATLTIINISTHPVRVRQLQVGIRGPGVTCADDGALRWNAPVVPFPVAKNVTLQPGERRRFQASRPFYLPGSYFLEPVEQDINGQWGGIPPFTCVDLTVVETQP